MLHVVFFLYIGLVQAFAAGAEDVQTELQFDLCPAKFNSAAELLRLDPGEAKVRRVYLWDTPKGDLYRAGTILRLRIQKKKNVFTIKIRNLDPVGVPGHFWKDEEFKCEHDKHRARISTTCSLDFEVGDEVVGAALSGKIPTISLFSPLQREFLSLSRSSLSQVRQSAKLGPFHQRYLKFGGDFSADSALEYTKVEGFERLEFSARVETKRSDRKQAEILAVLRERGLTLCKGDLSSVHEYLLKRRHR